MDEDGALITAFDGEICFYKDGKAKGYHVFGVYEGFDMDFGIDDNDSDLHNVFERDLDFNDDIVNYYEQHPDPDVTVFEFDMANDSESGGKGGFEERNRKRIAELNTEDTIELARKSGV